MFRGLVAIVALGISVVGAAADSNALGHQQTEVSPSARYQIIQSSLMARDTFRLDRNAGRVWRLVSDEDDSLMWEEMLVQGRQPVIPATNPRFQLFLSGTLRRITFLVDGQTGQTWQVQSTKIDPDGPDTEDNSTTIWVPLKSKERTGG